MQLFMPTALAMTHPYWQPNVTGEGKCHKSSMWLNNSAFSGIAGGHEFESRLGPNFSFSSPMTLVAQCGLTAGTANITKCRSCWSSVVPSRFREESNQAGENVRGQLSGTASRVQFLMLAALAVNQPHWPPSVTGEKMSKVPYMAQQLVISQ